MTDLQTNSVKTEFPLNNYTQTKPTFDTLKMYFMEPYEIVTGTSTITITQPTIGEILNYGEKEFFSMINPFISNPTSYRLFLWEAGVDWNKISDYELFCILVKELHVSQTAILFGDLDFSKFDLYSVKIDEETSVHTLYNKEQKIEINEQTYVEIAEYLRAMFNMYPKVEKAKGKTTKAWIIEEEKRKRELEKDKNQNDSILLPLVSSCINHPGFKYNLDELRNVGIVHFMDSVNRLQVYENTKALLNGRCSGMIDTSKIDAKEFDFMRDIKRG